MAAKPPLDALADFEDLPPYERASDAIGPPVEFNLRLGSTSASDAFFGALALHSLIIASNLRSRVIKLVSVGDPDTKRL